MDTVKISWSGGKDSTASALLHLAKGDKCIIVCYVPMLDDKYPLIQREHFNFIIRMARRFTMMGADVFIISGQTFYEFTHKIATRNVHKGKPFGAAVNVGMRRGFCAFKRDSKVKAIHDFDKRGIKYDYEDVGLAADEIRRLSQLNENKRSILVELGFTEEDAKNYCIKNNALSPLYKTNGRDGCIVCPFAKVWELRKWADDWGPDAVGRLLEIEEFCKKQRPDRIPRPGNTWWSDCFK